MAHIVYVNGIMMSFFNSSLELTNRLAKRGHTITYLSIADVATKLKGTGFGYRQLKPIQYDDFVDWDQSLSRWEKLKRVNERRDKLIHLRYIEEDFCEILEGLEPDLILFDSELYFHIIASHRLDVPKAVVTNWFATWKSAKVPPLHLTTIPGEGFQGSWLGIELSWLRLRLENLYEWFRSGVMSVGLDWGSLIRYWTNKHGMPMTKLKLRPWKTPVFFKEIPFISLNFEELEFERKPDDFHHYLGGMVYEERFEEVDIDTRKQLDSLYLNRRQGDIDALIYASISTLFQADHAFLNKLLEAVRINPKWHLVMGVGTDSKILSNIEIPPNATILDWVPQLEILKHSDVCITHAGTGTFLECLNYEVPMVVYSGENWDQNGCAARLVYHGVGIEGDKLADNPVQIAEKVKMAMNDSSMKAKLTAFKDRYQFIEEEKVAERLVESLLRNKH